jgi:hypothetical protein
MARVWVILPGGRVKRFKAPQVRHNCRKRRKGRRWAWGSATR